ncbi:hypothetical protein H072_2110 [Dactylellina haptotyla CBS 200.50]|uniref:RRM domain-containing protein n=1 Tax=Dactylellina haptotyla (strain CBS 200.50) TaxID=1284197 RepID=S8BWT0_DACHA|nr:hypothetical protein H072_2110 [Dactylellina haptotyla CBS 200.50]
MGNVLQRPAGALNSDEYIILVGNIPWRGRWQDLKDLVRDITPNVQRVEIYLTQDGRSRGFGYIIIKERDEALKVVERLDGYEWHGRALMVKLGNEANPVPVLAQQPNSTSPSEGNLSPEYVPVPPLPSEYNSNANFPEYSNLIPSQLAAFNEWIAIQAHHHYQALAHNANVYIQEERTRHKNLANKESEEVDVDDALQRLSLVDGTGETLSSAVKDLPPTRDNERNLEEYRRQATMAQRNAAFFSSRHHALLNEERSRFQDNSPGFQSSSSSSTPSSSSPFSINPSGRGTPNQPSNNRQQSQFLTISPPQQPYNLYHLPHQRLSSPPMSFANPNYIPQRGMPDPNTQRVSHPYIATPSPLGDGNHQSRRLPNAQDHINLSHGNPSAAPFLFNQNDVRLLPSFYASHATGSYNYGYSITSPAASVGSSRYPPVGQQHYQFQAMQQAHTNRENQRIHHPNPAAIPPTPMFINNAAGVPVNLSHGAVQTESRGIFIGNLPYNTHWRDLRTFLSPAGTIIRCDVPRKPNNKGRGYATVLFSSAEDAERACDMFNGTMYQGRQIRVRLDTYANTKSVDAGATVASASTASASGGGSGSGGNQSSFFTDGDADGGAKQGEDQGRRKSSASV